MLSSFFPSTFIFLLKNSFSFLLPFFHSSCFLFFSFQASVLTILAANKADLLSVRKDQTKGSSGELIKPNAVSMSFYSGALTSWGLPDTGRTTPPRVS